MKKEIKLKTLSYAMDYDVLMDIVAQLDAMFDNVAPIKKVESGEAFKDGNEDWEGHTIQYKIDGKDIFFAMSHSNGNSYLVRSDEKLIGER